MSGFLPATRAWFEGAFAAPTEVQARGWPLIAEGKHVLLCAPTGSGKTLAAFLSCIDRLSAIGRDERAGTRVVYVSPLKALVYDIDRNLRAPLAGIARAAARAGEAVDLPRVAVRTGDTTARERRHQLREPGDILVTTPESLYLMLGSSARETLRAVDTVIVDEVHALAPQKRGAHLALSLERLAALGDRDPQRIGLSATANPLETVAAFLGGDRPVEIVDASRRPDIDLRVVAAAADMTRPEETAFVRGDAPPPPIDLDPDEPPADQTADTGMWAAILPALVADITAHRQTIVFVNSRALAERLTHRICEIAGAPIARAHHGSLAHAERRVIEEQLKSGSLPAIVATSSLELGIDMGAVDLVLLVEAPKSTASGLQRIGRAGHAVGETSVGRLFPKHRGDLLEAAAVAEQMAAGRLEAIAIPKHPLDVLAQHVVAAVGVEPREVAALGRLIRRAANFRELPESAYLGVLDMLAGRYPSASFSDLRARIDWDRAADTLTARRGSKMLAIIGGGTIPDRGLYRVVLGDGGPRIGELDEEMVNETTPGQTITLGASTWRVTEITRDKVVVTPAPGEIGTLPFWRGEGPGRPLELGRALGALIRRVEERDDAAALEMLGRDNLCDDAAAENLLAYLREQADVSALPTDRRIVVERFRDELGDYRVCLLSPFGARVHAPWALALEAELSAQTGLVIQTMWSDDGIVLRFLDGDAMPEAADLVPDPDDVERLIVDQLAASSLFASQFRENAARSLLLPRRRPGERTPLWLQRLKSQQLLSIAREFPAFPIIMETYRSCLQDVFDTGALVDILRGVRSRAIELREVETSGPSPMARSLVFAYVAAFLYEADAPLAERRAQALALDRDLLRELLGGDKLRELLDPEVIAAVEATMLGRGRVETPGQLLDLLRRVGDLDDAELAACAASGPDGAIDAGALFAELALARQACPVRLGDGAAHHIAMEDVGLYRDALGCVPPPAAPAAFLEPVDTPLDDLLIRFLRNRGPTTAAEIADRYRLPAQQTAAVLTRLAAAGQLVAGGFRRGRSGTEYCHPEVLRRIKRDTLAVLRGEVAPVDPVVLGRFLPRWHGIAPKPGRGIARLEEAIAQLEGLPMSFHELETVILPSRVADYAPAMLDELGAMGQLVWVGRGASGPRDGRVALYRREHAAALVAPPDLDLGGAELGELHRAILDGLRQRGASFFVGIKSACESAGTEADTEAVIDALWDLVWLGAITNDTFGPLRARGRRKAASTRGRARRIGQVAGGRWSLVAELAPVSDAAIDATRAAHRRAVTLLERHGVVCRESVAIEDLPGGFSALYPVFREMEETGRVRRGYFVDGLGGAQFTLPGAVDRLRAAANKDDREIVVLAASDPANPWGWLVPWPPSPGDGAPRRAVGAHVIIRGGEPVLFVDRGGKRMVTFPAAADPEIAADAAKALEIVARRQKRRSLRVETIDGQRARTAALADALLAAGFYADASGLALDLR